MKVSFPDQQQEYTLKSAQYASVEVHTVVWISKSAQHFITCRKTQHFDFTKHEEY